MTLDEKPLADQGSGGPVCLTVPAERRYLRMVRLLSSSAAADLGFDIDAIEDLRVLVDEACAALIAVAAPGAAIDIAIEQDGESVQLSGSCRSDGAPPQLHPVAAEIVNMLADEVELQEDEGTARFALRKARDLA